jgi:hypothetical protein
MIQFDDFIVTVRGAEEYEIAQRYLNEKAGTSISYDFEEAIRVSNLCELFNPTERDEDDCFAIHVFRDKSMSTENWYFAWGFRSYFLQRGFKYFPIISASELFAAEEDDESKVSCTHLDTIL